MAVLIGSARSDENGNAHSGKAGDQKSGKEVSTQSWYKHSKGWRTFRCKDPEKAKKMAEAMRMLCDTNNVGYDQWQRNTLYDALKKVGWDLLKLDKAVETDCSALIRVCAACAGIMLPDFNTSSEANTLLASGQFVELTGSKYTEQDDYLESGDVLVTKTKGHTVMALTNGSKAKAVSAATGPVVKKGSWNIRSGPGTGYGVLEVAHGGDRLSTVDTDGWIAIKHGGGVAWISKNAVEEG